MEITFKIPKVSPRCFGNFGTLLCAFTKVDDITENSKICDLKLECAKYTQQRFKDKGISWTRP